jgi:hypothetical protein
MDKNTKNIFIGQPIFTQILSLVNRQEFNKLVSKTQSDRYYKTFKTWHHFVCILYGVLSRCDSVTQIIEGLIGCVGKLQHFGLSKPPAKSTLVDSNRERNNHFFESLYYQLVKKYSSFLSSSQTFGLTVKELLIIDSTTIQLFSNLIFKGVGRNPKDGGQKKGGLKVHMLIDALQDVARFVKISSANMHDRMFLKQIELKSNSMVVFDKAYNDYKLFANWTMNSIWFVTRMKENAIYQVIKTIFETTLKTTEQGVYKEEHIKLKYKENKNDKEEKYLILRRVSYRDEKGRYFVFISNNFEITSQEIAAIYKRRWQIELLFKKMKRNFQLRYFYGDSENTIRMQIWITLIAQLLLTVIRKKSKTQKAFSTIAYTVRVHLLSYLDLMDLLKNSNRFYEKYQKKINYANTLFPEFSNGA